MVEIPTQLCCLYTATLDERDGAYILDVPHEEIEQGSIESGETYRVALLARPNSPVSPQGTDTQHQQSEASSDHERSPPVEKGDVREVTIETTGDQGDGIAKIDRGYVVIVPGARPNDQITVEIVQARENVAFAQIRDDDSVETSAVATEPVSDDTLDAE